MSDGSFPIVTVGDLQNAIQAFGRAGNPSAAKRHIIRRAKALGRSDLLPESWNVAKMSATSRSGRPKLEQEQGMSDLDLSALDEDVREAIESHIEKLTAQIAEYQAEPEDVEKTAPPEVQAILKQLKDQNEALETRLAKAEEDAAIQAATEKAIALGFLGTKEELAPVLRGASPELQKVLERANAQLKESHLFKEFGTPGDVESDPLAKRESWVSDFMKEQGVSRAQARAAFWKANPDLRSDAVVTLNYAGDE